jgi:exopolysaccharide biosynthesis polyprenyl glycosylphosphotransferase
MLKDHSKLIHRLAASADVLISAILFITLLSFPHLHRGTGVTRPEEWRLLATGLVATLTWWTVVHQLGLYKSLRRKRPEEIIFRFVIAAGVSTAILTIAMFLTAAPLARRFPLIFGASQMAALGLIRVPVFAGLRKLRRSGRNYRDTLVVGTGARAAMVERTIAGHPEWGIRIVAFLDDEGRPPDPSLEGYEIKKVIEIPDILKEEAIEDVILACPLSMLPFLRPLVAVCAEAGVPVTLLSDLFGDNLPPPEVSQLGSLSALSFAPVHHNELKLSIKRIIDVVGASVLLIATGPIIGIAALFIRWSSPGPVFFRQRRCGLHGRRFEFLKLRTMYVDADERKLDLVDLNEMDGPVFKIHDDPRITPVGRFLRTFSIDEFPQFWNVLIGDMSLVGPRPPLPNEVDQYSIFERRRISMRPGITCIWQVSGRNEIGFDDWVKLDLQYIDSWSLTKDLEILLKTVPAVLRGTGS